MFKAATPITLAVTGLTAGPAVSEIYTYAEQIGAADDVATFYDCEKGVYPVIIHNEGLWCAGIDIEEVKDKLAQDTTITPDWAATKERVKNDYEASKRGWPVATTALLGVGAVAVGGVLDLNAHRISLRRLNFALFRTYFKFYGII